MAGAKFSPMEHFVYPILDVECGCAVCQEWRSQRDTFDELKRQTLSHDRSCRCWRCQKRRQHQQSFLAAAAKRELYSEMSYHAANHPSYGPTLMNWVEKEISDNDETDGWWATLAQAYPLSYWFGRFQSSMIPVPTPPVGGQLLVNGTNGHKPRRTLQWWCSWCGDDTPEIGAKFCSDPCAADSAAYLAAGQPTQIRRKLTELVDSCVYAVSGASSWAASGVAA